MRKNILPLLGRHGSLLALLAVGAAVRIYRFGAVPGGLNQDEASGAYDAYAVLNYGIDRSGFPYPAVFVGWGSGMHTLPYYLTIPFIAAFGLNVPSVRVPILLCNLTSLPIFYVLIRRISDRETALTALFLLAIAPWHIMSARWNHEFALLPPFVVAGVCLLVLSVGKPRYFPWSLAVFALALYTYGPAYLVVPVLLGLSCGYLLSCGVLNTRCLLKHTPVFLVLALPALLFVVINQYHLPAITTPILSMPRLPRMAHYQVMSSLFGSGLASHARENLKSLWALLLTQHDGLIWNEVPGYGFLYRFSLPLILLGLGLLLSDIPLRRFDGRVLMILWLLTSVALAAVMPANLNRISIIFFPLTFCLAVSIRRFLRYRLVFASLLLLYAASFASFAHRYFTSYADQVAPAFFASLDEAIDYASDHTEGLICVTDRVNMSYIFVLFYRRIDPRAFASTVQYGREGGERQDVRSFERYVFGLRECKERNIGAYVLDNSEVGTVDRNAFDVQPFRYYAAAVRK